MALIEPRTLKGFRDYAPKEQLARQAMFNKIQTVFEQFGFLPLSTPVLEYKDVLMNKYGDDEKLVYSFTDMGGRDVAMRYDLTVPMARFVAQNQHELVYPFKRYQIALAWRADNTQRGRLREFYQCDVDAVGTTAPIADAETIACVYQAFVKIGVPHIVLRLNDRRLFNCFLDLVAADTNQASAIIRSLDKVDKIGVEGVVADLREKGFTDAVCERARIYLGLGRGFTALDSAVAVLGESVAEGVASLREIHVLLQQMGVPDDVVVFDPTIARGSDYYTGTIFEWYLKDNWAWGSIGSGGRYDNLVDQFSERSLPATGASIGIDRLFEWLEDQGLLSQDLGVEIVVLNMGAEYLGEYIRLVTALRAEGLRAEVYYETSKLDKQFKYAESKGARIAILLGEEERKNGTLTVKNLRTREQVTIPESDLRALVQAL